MNVIYAFCSLLFAIGVFLIIGTILKIKIITDPPREWERFYSHSYINNRFGNHFLTIYNYVVGAGMVIFSIFLLIQTINGNVVF